ncbi:FtsX-like permease family protein [Candidatus Parcubacteria bacterium]|nr:MAG: FtsX-like permease family protein [Candidatus Parcubacteria bacterium]
MLPVDIFRLATRMFRTNRSRTILTILGISVGIGTILFLESLGYGLQNVILGQITSSEALLSLDVTTGDLEALKIDDQVLEEIKSIPNVEKVRPLVTLSAQMSIEDISTEITANFASSDYFVMEGTELKSGEFYTDNDSEKIIISTAALQLFDLSEEDIYQKEIYFSFFMPSTEKVLSGGPVVRQRQTKDWNRPFKVVGVVEDETESFVYLPFVISQQLDVHTYDKLKVKVNKDKNLDLVRSQIIDKGYAVSALSDIIEQAQQIFKVAQIVLALFGIIALIVSAIGMFNTMTIALLERTQEIGIMKALGATGFDVLSLFLAESVIIGFLGGVGGIVLGILGGEFFNYLLNVLAGALGGEKLDLFYTPPWFVVLIVVFSTLVGLLTGLYPAKRAAKLNCLDALRYK